VSEHDAMAEEIRRPQRRRRESGDGSSGEAQLQLVETQAAAPSEPPAVDDNLPRRTKPRRRRSGTIAEEPLQLVETQGTDEPASSDSASTP
jgi:hypothetical protein